MAVNFAGRPALSFGKSGYDQFKRPKGSLSPAGYTADGMLLCPLGSL